MAKCFSGVYQFLAFKFSQKKKPSEVRALELTRAVAPNAHRLNNRGLATSHVPKDRLSDTNRIISRVFILVKGQLAMPKRGGLYTKR